MWGVYREAGTEADVMLTETGNWKSLLSLTLILSLVPCVAEPSGKPTDRGVGDTLFAVPASASQSRGENAGLGAKKE